MARPATADPGKADLADFHVFGYGFAAGTAVAGEDVEHTLGNAGFLGEAGKEESGERGFFGGFEDESVAGDECGGGF